MSDRPHCPYPVWNGEKECGLLVQAKPGGGWHEYCRRHQAIVDGQEPPRRRRGEQGLVRVEVDETPGPSTDPDDGDDGPVEQQGAVSSLRAALRDASSTAQVAKLINDVLLEGLKASKTVRFTCPHCQKIVATSVPDLGTRVNAASKLIEEIEGKVQAAKDSTMQQAVEAAYGALESLSDEELVAAAGLGSVEDWVEWAKGAGGGEEAEAG